MKKILALFIMGILSFVMPPAFAHSELVSSNPSASANIEQLPEQIELEFNEELLNIGTGNSLSIMSPSGEDLGMGETSTEGAKITRLLNTTSETGQFQVKYRVASADGHVLNGSYTFNLNEAIVPITQNENAAEPESGSNLLVTLVTIILGVVVAMLLGLGFRSRKRRITSTD
ncbi:MAG: copper resistance protein CopC [Actinobacteria bacterium]|nr:copper resistance protein CopC [Actinomycetota bacterium]